MKLKTKNMIFSGIIILLAYMVFAGGAAWAFDISFKATIFLLVIVPVTLILLAIGSEI